MELERRVSEEVVDGGLEKFFRVADPSEARRVAETYG